MLTNTTAHSDSYSIFDCSTVGRRPPASDAIRWRCNNIKVAPNCPRCASTNTKFCYYNNYSLSQPRYFCKACRRYWTKGGSLRNVPVGGGCRKSRRPRPARINPNPTPRPDARPDASPCFDLAAASSENYSQIEDGGIFDHHRELATMDGSFDFGDNDQVRCGAADQFFAGQEMDGRDFACQGFGPIEIQQGVIDDDIPADVFWSSEGTTDLPDFGAEVQPVMQVLGLFSSDDQFRDSGNLLADNWAPLDLSAYELFSNPLI